MNGGYLTASYRWTCSVWKEERTPVQIQDIRKTSQSIYSNLQNIPETHKEIDI